jgi:O-succinylbenzoic acid--CoA ligase
MYSIFDAWVKIPEFRIFGNNSNLNLKNEFGKKHVLPGVSGNSLAFVSSRNPIGPLLIAYSWYQKIPILPLPEKATIPEYQHFLEITLPAVIIVPSRDHPICTLVSDFYPDIILLDEAFLYEYIKNQTQKQRPGELQHNTSSTNRVEARTVNTQTVSKSQTSQIFGYYFTSGSSAAPKCVPIRRRQIIAAWKASDSNINVKPGELWLHSLPLNHIGGTSIITRSLLSGSGFYWSRQSSPEAIINLLEEQSSVVGVSLVPTQLKRMMDIRPIKVSPTFKAVLLGGGPATPELINQAKANGLPVIPSFGMTETAAQCMAVPINDWQLAPLGTCGKPLPGVEARISQGESDADDTGLLWVRGKQVFNGYIGSEGKSADFDQSGWFCTGDYASVDKNGYYFIKMRRTDRIVSGGENINPSEVEHVIREMGLLDGDFAVFAIPDSEWGQAVCLAATNTASATNLTPKILKQKLSASLSAHKIPKHIVWVDAIPRTETGKIKRFELNKIKFRRDSMQILGFD